MQTNAVLLQSCGSHGDREGRLESECTPRGFVRSKGQSERKAGARPWSACYLYVAMLRFYHLFDDSQAEAGAAGSART